MDGAVWGFIGVIIGGLTTGLVTLGVELIRANKAASLDSAKRQDDRQLGRDQFQRETLLKLQAAINELMAALHALPTPTKGAVTRPGAEATVSAYGRTALRVGTLGSRVDDEMVRTATEKLVILGATIVEPEAWLAADAALDRAGDIAAATLSRSGELIRATFVDPSSRSDLLSYPPTTAA
jgi:hypothetical protein